jgi:hypothetical protein
MVTAFVFTVAGKKVFLAETTQVFVSIKIDKAFSSSPVQQLPLRPPYFLSPIKSVVFNF